MQFSNICLYFLATQQFYEIRKGGLIQIHASSKWVSKSDMFALIYLEQLNHRKMQFISKIARYVLGS